MIARLSQKKNQKKKPKKKQGFHSFLSGSILLFEGGLDKRTMNLGTEY